MPIKVKIVDDDDAEQVKHLSHRLSSVLEKGFALIADAIGRPQGPLKSHISEINIDKLKIKGVIMAVTMKDTQQAQGVISFVDKKGAATDAASVDVSTADTNVATASYDDPNNTVTVVAGQPGVTALKIVAKDSQGNELPFDDVAIEVTAGDAVSGTINFGTPTEQGT